MNRMALEKIVQLYSNNPIFQDLLETAGATGIAALGQAVLTDMTPEEIALASAAGFGSGMAGRPIGGKIGQMVGTRVDRADATLGRDAMQGVRTFVDMLPGPAKKAYEAKLGPYAHMGGAAQYGNLLGRSVGDNIAQTIVALAAPGIMGGEEDV